jgi:hypothetical protein
LIIVAQKPQVLLGPPERFMQSRIGKVGVSDD